MVCKYITKNDRPLSQLLKLTAPLTRGAFGDAAEKEKDI